MGCLDCLEGPLANTWLRIWIDREEIRFPLTFDEVWKKLKVRGSCLPGDHYHQMLRNFHLFSPSILHKVQDQKQRFPYPVKEAEQSGGKLWNAKSKNSIFDKPSLRESGRPSEKQSEDKVKTWWAEVKGFDARTDTNSVRGSRQKSRPSSFSTVKFTE